jgi:hypothetical protein
MACAVNLGAGPGDQRAAGPVDVVLWQARNAGTKAQALE